jgi:hypothetical protein
LIHRDSVEAGKRLSHRGVFSSDQTAIVNTSARTAQCAFGVIASFSSSARRPGSPSLSRRTVGSLSIECPARWEKFTLTQNGSGFFGPERDFLRDISGSPRTPETLVPTGLLRLYATTREAISFASQAGRRRFDPGHPLSMKNSPARTGCRAGAGAGGCSHWVDAFCRRRRLDLTAPCETRDGGRP